MSNNNSEADGMFGKLVYISSNLNAFMEFPIFSFHPKDILSGIGIPTVIKLAVYIKSKDAKKFRKGVEYGSAAFGTEKDIEPFINHTDPDNNLIFSATEQMSMEGRMPSPLLNRNKNVLIVGGSGSGKTRFYAKPNIMQCCCSIVVTDPKGTTSVR